MNFTIQRANDDKVERNADRGKLINDKDVLLLNELLTGEGITFIYCNPCTFTSGESETLHVSALGFVQVFLILLSSGIGAILFFSLFLCVFQEQD